MNYFKDTATRIFQNTAYRLWWKEAEESQVETVPKRIPRVYGKVKITKGFKGDTKRF